mmetsp:Transcript_57510/g.158301  ORF Transcript_57510/g.158301 Transcript_57510/m.158301 type:complete len:215 (-) Transcript_57510:135-779(-)
MSITPCEGCGKAFCERCSLTRLSGRLPGECEGCSASPGPTVTSSVEGASGGVRVAQPPRYRRNASSKHPFYCGSCRITVRCAECEQSRCETCYPLTNYDGLGSPPITASSYQPTYYPTVLPWCRCAECKAGGNEELRAAVQDRRRWGGNHKFTGRPRTDITDYARPGEVVQPIDPSGWGYLRWASFGFRLVYAVATGRIGHFIAHLGTGPHSYH